MGNAPSLCADSEPDRERPTASSSFLSAFSPANSSGDVATDVLTFTLEHTLDSQGLRVANDGTAAFAHFSTVCPEYYMSRYGSPTGINMDRGGFGQSASSGRNYAAIFDGVSAGGAVNAYAAQHFTQNILEFLSNNDLTEQLPAQLGNSLFHQAAAAKPQLQHSADGGSATGAFVWFVPCRGPHVMLSGAAIGDSAVIVIDLLAGTAEQLNGVDRIAEFGTADSGGQIAIGMGVVGRIASFSVNVDAQNTLVLLATDGLTDNLVGVNIVPLIVSLSFFDECRVPGWSQPHLPDEQALRGAVEGSGTVVQQLADVSCRDAVIRLSNYVEWVTAQRAMHELQYFQVELQYHELIRQRSRSDEGMMHGAPTSSHCQQRVGDVERLGAELKRLQALKAERVTVGKTDDAMLVAITPYNCTHPVMRGHPRVRGRPQLEAAAAVRRTHNTNL
eukprot:TRINITY_DN18696_c0_g1_i2.p1 TRINITY_DN18696_c0_g1~~TRINITY_DN18696_c0_g1_i2.p1  ORF type:complete len:446 (+),score=87.65 TRINITY_DN18696_c0_g1_i2:242-1579(+)